MAEVGWSMREFEHNRYCGGQQDQVHIGHREPKEHVVTICIIEYDIRLELSDPNFGPVQMVKLIGPDKGHVGEWKHRQDPNGAPVDQSLIAHIGQVEEQPDDHGDLVCWI